jgi:probable phosphoglycerate mutase
MEIWLVRHGESTWNAVRRFQGGRDAPLSARGRAEAALLAARLRGLAFDALYTSPLSRAADTARACGAALGLEPVALDELREIGLGVWEGRTLDEVRAEAGEGYRRWLEAPLDHAPPRGEALAVLAGRVGSALDALVRRHGDGGRVLVVSHGGVIACLVCDALGVTHNALWRFRLANASITRLARPPARLLALNEIEHLRPLAEAGEPLAAAPAPGTTP